LPTASCASPSEASIAAATYALTVNDARATNSWGSA
jgi:hypothetical protein